MGKAKRGLLLGGTILTIVGSILALIVAILMFWLGSKITDMAIVEIFRSAPEQYKYYTNYLYQGVTYEYVIVDIVNNEIMLPEVIKMTASLFQTLFKVFGFIVAAFAGIKLLLAIIALAVSGKKMAKGTVITLIVFSFLTVSILEAALLIAALCVKSKKEEVVPEQAPEVIA